MAAILRFMAMHLRARALVFYSTRLLAGPAHLGSRHWRAQPLPHPLADAVDCLLAFGEHGCEEVPDVDHLRPDLEGGVHASGFGPLRQACRVVEQHLVLAYLDE